MILVSDNLQITNKAIEAAVEKENPAPIRELVLYAVEKGAEAIDINSGPLGKHAAHKMTFLVETVQEATSLPILIDTANPVAMKAGLSACKNKKIINGFSLEPRKLDEILPLALEYDTDIIGYLLYPNSHVPPDSTERLSIAVKILEHALNAGIEQERLIIDPVLAPLTWQNGKAQAFEILETIRLLPEMFGFNVRTIIGLSNLTTGGGRIEKRLLFEKTYLPMLAASGLNMALMNIMHEETVAVANACKRLKDDKVFSWEG